MRKHAWIAVALALPAMFCLAKSLPADPPGSCSTGKMLASRLQNDLVVVLMNDTGNLTAGGNHLCVVFRKVETGQAVEVQHVVIDFILLVGRIQEKPITIRLTPDGMGYYRGEVDLGRQYYNPASYYGIVYYIDSTGKERKARLHLTVS